MPLQFKFKSREEISAEQVPFYAERDGGWVLDVEGAVDKSKVEEFRSQNVELMRQVEAYRKEIEGLSSAAGPREAREQIQGVAG